MKPLPVDRPEILIIAAEASSALYAQRLLELWRERRVPIHAFGIGNQAMVDLGFEALGRSEELAVVGIQEVLAHWSSISQAFHSLHREADRRKPRVALLIDYPDFNLRLAKKLKALGIPVVYFISPQVWAWRQSRVKKIRACVDLMLVLFPFEKEFYDRHRVPCEFVGHPLLDELHGEVFSEEKRTRRRAQFGVSHDELVLGLMPGSRRSELKHHLAIQLATAERVAAQFPKVKTALLVAPTFSVPEIRDQLPSVSVPIILMKDDPLNMIQLTDVVLCASGTATLFVGLLRKPMVIMYRMSAVTAQLAKWFVKGTAHFGMINLIIGRRVVPELFQEKASPEQLALEIGRFVADPELRRRTSEELALAERALGEQGAMVRVAQHLERYLQAPSWVPVVSVGNLTVGGTGKTPVVQHLVRWFNRRGLRAGIVSRGYRGTFRGAQRVDPELPDAAAYFGDEPAMLASQLPNVPVFVSAKRASAVKALLAAAPVDVIVADDAFQHRSLQRNLDIVILDAMAPEWEYRLLPFGRMRESWRGLERADAVILSKANLAPAGALSFLTERLRDMGFPTAEKPVVLANYLIERLVSSEGRQLEVSQVAREKWYLCSGIGRPESFAEACRQAGALVVGQTAFRDHYAFSRGDWQKVEQQARARGADRVVVTAKDAVKLKQLVNEEFWWAELGLQFGDEINQLYAKLEGVLREE